MTSCKFPYGWYTAMGHVLQFRNAIISNITVSFSGSIFHWTVLRITIMADVLILHMLLNARQGPSPPGNFSRKRMLQEICAENFPLHLMGIHAIACTMCILQSTMWIRFRIKWRHLFCTVSARNPHGWIGHRLAPKSIEKKTKSTAEIHPLPIATRFHIHNGPLNIKNGKWKPDWVLWVTAPLFSILTMLL